MRRQLLYSLKQLYSFEPIVVSEWDPGWVDALKRRIDDELAGKPDRIYAAFKGCTYAELWLPKVCDKLEILGDATHHE